MAQQAVSPDNIELGNHSALAWLAGLLAGRDPIAGLQEVEPYLPGHIWAISGFSHLRSIIGAASTRLTDRENSKQAVHDPRIIWESERIRLFEMCPGGVPAPPYGSWWMEGCLMGDTTAAAARWYQQEKLSVKSGPADYLPTELEFLSYLLADQVADTSGTLVRVRQECRFMDELLLPWAPVFCVTGEKASRIELWWHVLDALSSLLNLERSRIGQLTGTQPNLADI